MIHWYDVRRAVVLSGLGLLGCSRVIGADAVTFDERPECTVQADCNGFDADDPRVCVQGSCAALRNDAQAGGDCKLVLGEASLGESAPPFVFGVLSAVGGVTDELSSANKVFDLAFREFQRRGGITIAGRTRAPVAVVCDTDGASDEQLERTLDHLTGTLAVPGLIAPLPSTTLKRHFERVHLELGRSAFFLSPFDSDPLLATVEDDGELWHLLGPSTSVGLAYPPLVRRAERYVNPPTAGGMRPPIRLALLNDGASITSEMANVIEQHLSLNGSSALDNGPEYYRRFALDSGDDYATALEALVAFEPHIVVSAMNDAFLTEIMLPLEINWPESSGQARPFYVLSPFQVDSVELLDLVANAIPDARTRTAGVSLASAHDSPVYQDFQRNVNAEYQDPALENMENLYDAMYFLLYAAAASDAERPSGAALAHGMRRLVSGEPFAMGQEHIPAVLAKLNESPSTSIALEGTLGPPDFDVETGTRLHTPSSVFCIAEDDGALAFRHDALVYDPALDALEGDFDCFAGFPAE